ncbi:MAG: MotA/TolQ/ExbB proton channel family protein [Phycisphaerae bacterium]|nr:MotA/TolQ/ExbB proton channel family protein [Phycisphaerae bacterium]
MFNSYIQYCGAIFWPLSACSFFLGVILVERTWTILILKKILRRNLSQKTLLWHQNLLPFFKDIPPAIGLLGTVLGVIQSFGLGDGRITAESAGTGLATACYTTVMGLSVAIVASVFEYILNWLILKHTEDIKG